jgi:UDP-N-acetylmuramoyl-L-alanyl-D-glutamate--2,6-diaminopimelate ligase
MWQPIIRKIIPKKVRNLKHLIHAYFGACKNGNPSEKMFVIGVTGTVGKSTTISFLRQILEHAGYVVGSLSTIDFYIAGKNMLNDQKMTMLGKSQIQKYLREMVEAGCDIAIVEVTSEGFVQHRHRYINFDTIVFTNLYPEHIESHGSFKKYKNAKLGIFKYVSRCKKKYRIDKFKKVTICNLVENPKELCSKMGKTCIVNANSEFAKQFLQFDFDTKILYGRKDQEVYIEEKDKNGYKCIACSKGAEISNDGMNFVIDRHRYHAPVPGEHNLMNILASIATATSLDIEPEKIMQGVAGLAMPPGRAEFIEEAGQLGFKVIVDYAFEPVALGKLYDVVNAIKPQRTIHVCGSCGGGRDKLRRGPIGKLVGERADLVIVTNEDPYDEDPMEIIKAVSAGAQEAGKKLNKNLFEILDRKEAIEKAISLAQEGDLVLVTGKGSEQKMCVAGGRMVDWDDRKVVKEALRVKSNSPRI